MRFLALFILVVFVSCKSSKDAISPERITSFKKEIANKNIDVEFEWAQPSGMLNNVSGIQNILPIGSSAANVNLVGISNFLKISKDSIALDLPYYGEQQILKGYLGSDIGIKFFGIPMKFTETFNEERNRFELKYSLKSNQERLDLTLFLFASHKATLAVVSSHRTTINYNGNWKGKDISEPKESP